MKFTVATSSILLWALHAHAAPSPAPGTQDFNSGVYHGVDVAEHLWDDMDGTCSEISMYTIQVETYLRENYPTDTGNWRTDSFNVGVESGAGQVVEKYENKCSSPIEQCSDGWNCESCLSNPDCTWFEDIGYCETGCGMEGCGATVCPSDIDTCKDCLGGPGTPASGQYSWSPEFNECLTSCDVIADASCYKGKSSADPGGYDPSICEEISLPPTPYPTSPIAPIENCSEGWDCESCLSNPDCTWFQDIGYCETGCGMEGCGATVCPSDIDTCKDCLGGPGTPASGQYSWSPEFNECLTSCDVIADASCYKGKSSADPSGYDPSICSDISDSPTPSPTIGLPIDQCSEGWDCESCLSNSECTWFADLGYCETMCGQLGCGAFVCAAEITTCEECLGGSGTDASGQYSWSPYTNECVEDCMFAPADAPCFKAKSSYDPSGYDPSICDDINNMHGKTAVS